MKSGINTTTRKGFLGKLGLAVAGAFALSGRRTHAPASNSTDSSKAQRNSLAAAIRPAKRTVEHKALS